MPPPKYLCKGVELPQVQEGPIVAAFADRRSELLGVRCNSMTGSTSISKDEAVLLPSEQQRCCLCKIQTLTVTKEGGKAVGREQEWILLDHFLSVLGCSWHEHCK